MLFLLLVFPLWGVLADHLALGLRQLGLLSPPCVHPEVRLRRCHAPSALAAGGCAAWTRECMVCHAVLAHGAWTDVIQGLEGVGNAAT